MITKRCAGPGCKERIQEQDVLYWWPMTGIFNPLDALEWYCGVVCSLRAHDRRNPPAPLTDEWMLWQKRWNPNSLI